MSNKHNVLGSVYPHSASGITIAFTGSYCAIRTFCTVFQKHVTTYLMISWTSTVRLQRFFRMLVTKTIGHRQIFLVSHLTYLVQLLYPEKLLFETNFHTLGLREPLARALNGTGGYKQQKQSSETIEEGIYCSYIGRPIGTRVLTFVWYRFRWPWMKWNERP